MPNCTVSYLDLDGIRHSVELDADSLYEAAVKALKVFKDHGWEPGGLAKLEVTITTSVTHEVTVKRVRQWLDSGSKSPKERADKERLKELLG
jgi:membrane-bound lytic murein transglycosylase B